MTKKCHSRKFFVLFSFILVAWNSFFFVSCLARKEGALSSRQTIKDFYEISLPDNFQIAFLGDSGSHSVIQSFAQILLAQNCKECGLAFLLGDIFYEYGLDWQSPLEAKNQFKSQYEDIFGSFEFPFYALLGNHDYGNPTVQGRPYRDPSVVKKLGKEIEDKYEKYLKGEFDIGPNEDPSAYSATGIKGQGKYSLKRNVNKYSSIEVQGWSQNWQMPNRDYSLYAEVADLCFYFSIFDTMVFNSNQREKHATSLMYARNKCASKSKVLKTFAIGHHPVFTADGKRDDAQLKDSLLPFLCNNFEFYFAGHLHKNEYLQVDYCKTKFVTTGTAGKIDSLQDNPGMYIYDFSSKFKESKLIFVELALESQVKQIILKFQEKRRILEVEKMLLPRSVIDKDLKIEGLDRESESLEIMQFLNSTNRVISVNKDSMRDFVKNKTQKHYLK